MKKLSISIILNFIALAAIAQSVNERTTGKNLLNGTDIAAREYSFAERIHDYYVDTTTNCITLQLRGTIKNDKYLSNTGSVVLYDLTGNSEKWTRKINYQGPPVRQFNNTLIFPDKKGGFCLDTDTGKDKWAVKNTVVYVDPDYNIALGYSITKGDLLEGIDLANGAVVWSRTISREYGWNNFNFLNDSTALIAAAGLHTVNLKDGTGWDSDAVTARKDYTTTAAANAAGAVLGILTGTFAVTTGHDIVRDLASNTLITEGNIYFADAERISCFDRDGNTKWSAAFDKNAASKSNIFLKGDTLYMINLGYAFMGNRRLNYSAPFIAAYNRHTGERIFMTGSGGKKSPVTNWTGNGGSILLLFEDRIARYSLEDGSEMSERIFEGSGLGQSTGFAANSNYTKNGDKYESMVLSNPDKIFLACPEKIIVLNSSFVEEEEVGLNRIYIYYLNTGKYRFLSRSGKTIVIDQDSNEVATFEASGNAFLIGNKLYDVKNNVIVETDVTEFL